MQLAIKSMMLGVILGALVVLTFNNHSSELIKEAVANTTPPAPILLTEAATLNPDWYIDAWNMRYIVQEAMVTVLERCSVFVTGARVTIRSSVNMLVDSDHT
jgi:hypothetical protein